MVAPRRIDIFRVTMSEEAVALASSVLRSGYVGEGPMVARLESAFAQVSGTQWNAAVNSGTSALHLAMIAGGVGSGDEVITTAQTMMATSHAILMQRAVPVFADVQLHTGNIDPQDIEHRITERTRALLVVHWAGYPCDMEEIHAVARKHKLVVVEDAAHAVGARYRGAAVGSLSPLTCFSFQAIKHVCCGDGGMLSTLNAEHRERAARLRWFGIDRARRVPSILGEAEWNVTELGYKYQMNDIAAAIGVANLAHLGATLGRHREIARRYRQALASVPGITLLDSKDDRESACWLFTMLAERRVDLLRMLHAKGIAGSVVHMRIDTNDVYGGRRDDLPNLDRFTELHVSLPIHTGLSDDDVDYVIAAIKGGW